MRRALVTGALLFGEGWLLLAAVSPKPGVLDIDHRALISRADLTCHSPARRTEEGLPLGNGRTGSLVWTTLSSLKLQVNRSDVFANGCASSSFPERHTDYCGGCGFVDIDFVDYGDPVFPEERCSQHLACHEGMAQIEGKDLLIRALAWHEQDVLAIEITDRRRRPGTICVNLRMLRPPFVRTLSHTANSKLESDTEHISLTQRFVEADFFCASALAIRVVGRATEVRRPNEAELRLVIGPGNGPFTVLIGSAASLNRQEEVVSAALSQIKAAVDLGFERLAESNRKWWRDFWVKSFVHLHSEDGVADMIEANYAYFLYIMACTSRGKYPTKFNGMLWTTGGDARKWGAQYWGANQSCLYNGALAAANHLELIEPMFRMYSQMIDSCRVAATQQWGSQGIYFPETIAFDGLAAMPPEIAAEMRDLYLLKQPWESRSEKFTAYAATKQPHSSRWNWMQSGSWVEGRWIPEERGSGPYGPVTHIFSRGAKIAYQYWLRYEYSQDRQWLGQSAYPILAGVAEFYRHYPNLEKEGDGRYHIHHVNSNESIWGAQDTDEEISAMMGILPVAIRASEILDVDHPLREAWKELLQNLAPLPRSDNPRAAARIDSASSNTGRGPPVWIRGLSPSIRGNGSGRPDGNTMPMWYFDLCTLESDPESLRIGNATFDAYFPNGVSPQRRVGVLSKMPLVAAVLGRADAVKYLIPNQIQTQESPVLANRMDLREGAQTTSVQRLGNAADALQTALCQSLPPGPGQPSVIRVFAAWPGEWDAEYSLLCRGGFLVSSAMRKGAIEFVDIHSQFGGECRLRNPWNEAEVIAYRDGKRAGNMNGSLLRFSTARGERVTIVRSGCNPEQFRRTVPSKHP
jgi:hypothetical protein